MLNHSGVRASSTSAGATLNDMPIMPLSVWPGNFRSPATLRMNRRRKRPMLVLAREPTRMAPSWSLNCNSHARLTLTLRSGSQPGVAPACWMRNSGSDAASTTARRMGRYSRRQPAMTPLTATFHAVASRFSGGSTPSTSSALRPAKARKRSTRSGVGGTTGSPPVHMCWRKCSRMYPKLPRQTMSRGEGPSAAIATDFASSRIRAMSSGKTRSRALRSKVS